jgi:hypothetical protein
MAGKNIRGLEQENKMDRPGYLQEAFHNETPAFQQFIAMPLR